MTDLSSPAEGIHSPPGAYLSIIRRRRYWLLFPFIGLFLGSVIIVYSLPAVYKARATILIEQQRIPTEFVRTSVTQFVEHRMAIITQQIMSQSRLETIIEQFQLYDYQRRGNSMSDLIAAMRDDITITSISAEITDPSTGFAAMAKVAFTLEFENEDPLKAQRVTNALAVLFTEGNEKMTRDTAGAATRFMGEEADELRRSIEAQETVLADFKKNHFDSLPEMEELNRREIQETERELTYTGQNLKAAQEKKKQLEIELAGIDMDMPGIQEAGGDLTADAGQELARLQSIYRERSAVLSEKHPDLVNLRDEIQALEELVRRSDRTGPDRKQPAIPGNPVYIAVRTDIESVVAEIETMRDRQRRLRKRIAEYRERLARTPDVTARLAMLRHNYEESQRRYREVRDRSMDAGSAESLISSGQGQKFTIIDPAALPASPCKPNRLIIIIVSFLLSGIAAVGIATIREYTDQSVWSERELAGVTGGSVMAAIPPIKTDSDRRRGKRRIIFLLAALAGGTLLLLLAVQLFYQPLDVLWYIFLRKLGLG